MNKMELPDPNLEPPKQSPCDSCNKKPALVYCGADSAKLCLLCDREIHSANALSLKHCRLRVCDFCGIRPAWSLFYARNGAAFCQGCVSNLDLAAAADAECSNCREPVDAFSDSPSASELAGLWGIDLESLLGNYEDMVVPTGYGTREDGLVCGGFGKVSVCKQLTELGRRDSARVREFENIGKDREDWSRETPFTSLLMGVENGEAELVDGGDLLWNFQPPNQAAEAFSYQLQTLFNIKEPLSLTASKSEYLELMYDKQCSNIIESFQSNNDCLSHTESSQPCIDAESCGVPVIGSPSEPVSNHHEILNGARNGQIPQWGHVTGSELMVRRPLTKADLEQQAEHRGKAMIRYKEKKKSRRFDKHIRYESRKAGADRRKRYKGRFVK